MARHFLPFRDMHDPEGLCMDIDTEVASHTSFSDEPRTYIASGRHVRFKKRVREDDGRIHEYAITTAEAYEIYPRTLCGRTHIPTLSRFAERVFGDPLREHLESVLDGTVEEGAIWSV